MADPIKFTPKDRQGDPDFPGIPELARFYTPKPMTGVFADLTPEQKQQALSDDNVDWDQMAEERLGQRPPRTPK